MPVAEVERHRVAGLHAVEKSAVARPIKGGNDLALRIDSRKPQGFDRQTVYADASAGRGTVVADIEKEGEFSPSSLAASERETGVKLA